MADLEERLRGLAEEALGNDWWLWQEPVPAGAALDGLHDPALRFAHEASPETVLALLRRLSELEQERSGLLHIGNALVSLIWGIEPDEAVIEEIQQTADVWMKEIASVANGEGFSAHFRDAQVRAALSEVGGRPEVPEGKLRRADGRYEDCTGDCGERGLYCCDGAWDDLRRVRVSEVGGENVPTDATKGAGGVCGRHGVFDGLRCPKCDAEVGGHDPASARREGFTAGLEWVLERFNLDSEDEDALREAIEHGPWD